MKHQQSDPASKKRPTSVVSEPNKTSAKPPKLNIRDVWTQNFREELDKLSDLVLNHGFTHIFFDTEFAGFLNQDRVPIDFDYQDLKANVAQMKIIQIGITLSNTNGQTPAEADLKDYYKQKTNKKQNQVESMPSSWQFNFQFNQKMDRCQPQAIKLLKDAGINFKKLTCDGIKPQQFAQHFRMSGLGSNPKITWLAFNALHDFGYLLNLFQNPLPQNQIKFQDRIRELCPGTYFDVKHMGQGSLVSQMAQAGVEMSDEFMQHQAGSDSLATMKLYWARWNEKVIARHMNQIHKLNCSCDDGFILKSQGVSSVRQPTNQLQKKIYALIKVMHDQGYHSTVPMPQIQTFFQDLVGGKQLEDDTRNNNKPQVQVPKSAIEIECQEYQKQMHNQQQQQQVIQHQQPQLNICSECFNPYDQQRCNNSVVPYECQSHDHYDVCQEDNYHHPFPQYQVQSNSQTNDLTTELQSSCDSTLSYQRDQNQLYCFENQHQPNANNVDLEQTFQFMSQCQPHKGNSFQSCYNSGFYQQPYYPNEYSQYDEFGNNGSLSHVNAEEMKLPPFTAGTKSKWHYKRVRKFNGLF